MTHYIKINYDKTFKIKEMKGTIEFLNTIFVNKNRIVESNESTDYSSLYNVLQSLTDKEELLLRWYYHIGDENDIDFYDRKNYKELSKKLGYQNTYEMFNTILRATRKMKHPTRSKPLRHHMIYPKLYSHKINFKALLINELEDLILNDNNLIDDSYLKKIFARNNYSIDKLENYIKYDLSSFDIETLDLSVRPYNCLKRAGITDLHKLSKIIDNDNSMMKIRNLGKRSLNEVRNKYNNFIRYKKNDVNDPIYHTNITIHNGNEEQIKCRYILESKNSRIIAKDLYHEFFEKDPDFSLIKDKDNFFDTKTTNMLLMAGYTNIEDVIKDRDIINNMLSCLSPSNSNNNKPLDQFFDNLMLYLGNCIEISEPVYEHLKANDYIDIKEILHNSPILSMFNNLQTKIEELEKKYDIELNGIIDEINSNLIPSNLDEYYKSRLSLDTYISIVEKSFSMESIFKAQSYLSDNYIHLITSLIDFKDKADEIINEYSRNNLDNEVDENNGELFNDLRELFDHEYFDKSWIMELENYILKRCPEFKLNTDDE